MLANFPSSSFINLKAKSRIESVFKRKELLALVMLSNKEKVSSPLVELYFLVTNGQTIFYQLHEKCKQLMSLLKMPKVRPVQEGFSYKFFFFRYDNLNFGR